MSKISAVFFVLCCFVVLECGAIEDCDTIRARCRLCERSLQAGPYESPLAGAINRKCQTVVGRQYAWRTLSNCDMMYYFCEAPDWNCIRIAQMANMQRRLP